VCRVKGKVVRKVLDSFEAVFINVRNVLTRTDGHAGLREIFASRLAAEALEVLEVLLEALKPPITSNYRQRTSL
jgi:hypothetical protein